MRLLSLSFLTESHEAESCTSIVCHAETLNCLKEDLVNNRFKDLLFADLTDVGAISVQ